MSALPRLILIADGFAGGQGAERASEVQRGTTLAVRAGVQWVQLRDHKADQSAFEVEAERFARALLVADPDLTISVNTHVHVAQRLGVGLHVGVRGPAPRAAREMVSGGILSVAVHTIVEAERAAHDGAGTLVFSPVFPTASKPRHPGAGIDALAACCDAVCTPVFALGGITPERAESCRRAGAYGVAVLSGILDAADPAEAAARYLLALDAHP